MSYQDADLHNGNTYRFDGWKRIAFAKGGGTDARSGRKGARQARLALGAHRMNSYFGLLRQSPQSHADRARLANAVRRRGHCVNGTFTKTFRSTTV